MHNEPNPKQPENSAQSEKIEPSPEGARLDSETRGNQSDTDSTESEKAEFSGAVVSEDETVPEPNDIQLADGVADNDQSETNGLKELRRERDEYYDRLIRTTADFENYRKRTDREKREQAEYAAMELLKDLLPFVDGLERALAADGQDGEAYRRGVEIIHRQVLDLMARRGVTPIEALGNDFDPNLHQAVTLEASATHRDGEVIEELRRGYTFRERLLRASMVKVAKA